jgi:nucleotide exchange factor SIL1
MKNTALSRMILPLLVACTITSPLLLLTHAKEIEVTPEWQLLGENDTIPAGMHVRMDLSTGEKWVKLPDEDDSKSSVTSLAATVHPDGSVQAQEEISRQNADGNEEKEPGYDYTMMHRTLSKLPAEEMQKYGGLPELPSGGTKTILTPEERKLFEARMAQIWEQRQAELKEVQEQLLDVPEILKERMKGIKEYLRDPLGHLRSFNLDDEEDEDKGVVTHVISLLKDLEFQLTDLDNARDFHTLGGWELLVVLLSEDAHVQNNTISKLSPSIEAKLRAVQAHAAWTIGTAVKNTGEFFPYAIEPVKLNASTTTTALDMILGVFCKDYEDQESRPIRTLLTKSIYAIGALLRGNRIAQTRLVEVQGGPRLGQKLQQLLEESYDIKLVQRLISLAGDLITDIQLDGDASTPDLNKSIIQSFTTPQWCQMVSSVLTTANLLPVSIQETVMDATAAMAIHCSSWKEKTDEHKAAVRRFWNDWEENKDDNDIEHLNQLKKQATQLRKLL